MTTLDFQRKKNNVEKTYQYINAAIKMYIIVLEDATILLYIQMMAQNMLL